ncbi:WD40-repeat-containing domain protein [Protomyces lactucae-debilis]|uniref:WD40-repeat-containing domain protein n=1 Tax=Protomyces lactucae-debilis TaxID=2754530 RepID=A0A1Y2FSH4_PROLT|nr:WD40-repeat-containing domain protein [Protomyces lactucae-debilis]ORY86136.1 WD40-repeat-containing domain protein [Protomyces lactucae-debilis]
MAERAVANGTVRLDSSVLGSFKPSKAFNKTTSPITSIDFDDAGEHLITASQDETIQLYDIKQGKHLKTLFSKKYGVHLARFTHKSSNCIYASTKGDDGLRYLSLHDNSYVRYLKGHTGTVTSLEVSPCDDTVISAAQDGTVRLWDLNSPTCHGLLHIPSPSLAVFDPTGQLFAVASHRLGSILLYDLRNFDKEPFSTFTLTDDLFLNKFSFPPRMPEWTKVDFSNDGKWLLVGTRGEGHYILDAFTGEMRFRLTGHQPTNATAPSSGEICFTPDGRHVLAASGNKTLIMWDLGNTQAVTRDKSLPPAKVISSGGVESARVLAFSPKSAMLATADTELTMWLPDMK